MASTWMVWLRQRDAPQDGENVYEATILTSCAKSGFETPKYLGSVGRFAQLPMASFLSGETIFSSLQDAC